MPVSSQGKKELLLSKLETKCDALKMENERVLNHIYQIKKLVFKYKLQRKYLMSQLQKHEFNLNDCKCPLFNEEESNLDTNGDLTNDKSAKYMPPASNHIKVNSQFNKMKKLKTESKSDQKECNVASMPKKPINPYLLFCSENRTAIQEKYFQQHNVTTEISNQELTKTLAQNWHDLSCEDKQVKNN
ncbi:HMG1/2-like protein [Dinothrombium tinctorium]|uniref:HMG1/2-like protein n=1 Tax=Dinothrombium tinctorium TaxID=1965070 RepID=A0A3S3SHD0_9ACAR|nr:HMG1/2-like protein [Dinothrombium tinctorium]